MTYMYVAIYVTGFAKGSCSHNYKYLEMPF